MVKGCARCEGRRRTHAVLAPNACFDEKIDARVVFFFPVALAHLHLSTFPTFNRTASHFVFASFFSPGIVYTASLDRRVLSSLSRLRLATPQVATRRSGLSGCTKNSALQVWRV